MVEKEIIIGVERGGSPVPEMEIRQMSGRCGRGYEKPGEVVCIVGRNMSDYADECLNGDPKPVLSKFSHGLLFYALPDIVREGMMNQESFRKWFERSFYYRQFGKVPNFEKTFSDWTETECVVKHRNGVSVTEMGVLANRYYIRPEHALIMKEKLLSFDGADGLKVVSWLLSYEKAYADTEEHPDYDEFMSGEYPFDYDESVEAFAIYRMLLPSRPKWIRHLSRKMAREFERRLGFLEGLSKILGKDISGQIGLWRLQMERRVPEELYPLLKSFPDASIPVLNELESFNVREKSDLKKIELNYASKNLKKYLDGLETKKTD